MVTTSKKGAPKPIPRCPSLKSSNAKLSRENKELRRERDESLEREMATSAILRIIAGSPTEVQLVLDAVAESAARLCEANNAVIYRVDGDVIHPAAVHGAMPPAPKGTPLNRKTPIGRAIIDRQAIHVHDLLAEVDTEFPDSKAIQKITGTRTSLSTPLLLKGISIGAIHVRRNEVRPFTERQIKLLETFADQAVIAIENLRLFQELTQKTAELETSNSELRETLEQQTATSKVLGVIASSPTDIEPVLNTVAENAVRVCGAEDALVWRLDENTLRLAAIYGSLPSREIGAERPLDRGSLIGRAVMDRQTIHVDDLAAAAPEFPNAGGLITGDRTVLATPLLREDNPIGVIHIRRKEVRPFSDKQIALLKTFADQAVIAIENVRLFNELKESLERQTATSEILGVIASSPTDLQPVLDVVAENAARLCHSQDAQIHRVEGDMVRKVAGYGSISPVFAVGEVRPISRDPGFLIDRAILDGQTIHIHDMLAESEEDYPDTRRAIVERLGLRSALAVPLLRKGIPIGAILIRRTEVRPFTKSRSPCSRPSPIKQ